MDVILLGGGGGWTGVGVVLMVRDLKEDLDIKLSLSAN